MTLVLSDEASEHAALQAEITACKAALERERESRVQGEIELERALTLLKDNVAQIAVLELRRAGGDLRDSAK